MATNNATDLTKIIPSEPHPLPSLSSDDDSFVVLGSSLSDSDSAQSDMMFEHVSAEVIEEAKRHYETEMASLERAAAQKMTLDCVGDSPAVDDEPEGSQTPKAGGSSMEQSTINLPEMPSVDESLKNSEEVLSMISSYQPSELSHAEVQGQISHIINENLRLKEALTQNNLSMNSQIKRVLAWQEDVVKVHEAHKQKLINAKELIEKLKQENEVLTKRNEKLSNSLADSQNKVAEQTKCLEETNRKIDEIIAARSQGSNLEAALKKCRAENDELVVENLQLKKQLEEAVNRLTAENAQLKTESKKEKQLEEVVNRLTAELVVENLQLKKQLEEAVNRLTAENAQLKTESKKEKQLEEAVNRLTAENAQLKTESKKEKQLEEAVNRLTAENAQLKTESKKEKQLEEAVNQLAAENAQLKTESKKEKGLGEVVNILTAEIAQLETKITTLEEEKKQMEMHNRKLFDVEMTNERLMAEIDLLKESSGDSKANLEATVRELTKANEEMTERLRKITKVHENCQVIAHNLTQDCEKWIAELGGAEEQISLLKKEKESLTKSYEAKIRECNVTMKAYEAKIQECHVTMNAYEAKIQECNVTMKANEAKMQSCNFTMNMQTLETRKLSRKLSEVVASLARSEERRTASAAQAQNALAENERLNAALRHQMALKACAAREMDELYALRTQVEVSKADFEAEKNAKEVLKGEKETLIADMQNLQRRNQQLQEEIEMLRDNRDYVVYPSNRPHVNVVPAAAQACSQDPTRRCPKCSFGFTTQQALENHVYRCIELDDQLP